MFSVAPGPRPALTLAHVASYPRLRALTWDNHILYAASGYRLLRADMNSRVIRWEHVADHDPGIVRKVSSWSNLGFRLLRDGFHGLAVLPTGYLAAAVPGAIVTLAPGETKFRATHKITRGTRPLHIAVNGSGELFWGEYFDNRLREEVHIYKSSDHGESWQIAYTFPRRSIRHVHNIVYDRWGNCLWILTGDAGSECQILRASCNLSKVETVLSGNQQSRAVAMVPTADAVYFASDTPFETNFVHRLERNGKVSELGSVSSSAIYGCRVGEAMFFATMVEPSEANRDHHVRIFGSADGNRFESLLRWPKDGWHMRWFQYGNARLPDGDNNTRFLAVSTIAVQGADLETSLWKVTA